MYYSFFLCSSPPLFSCSEEDWIGGNYDNLIQVQGFGGVIIFFYLILNEGGGWSPEERQNSLSAFLQSGNLWHKHFFARAALLWVEISSHRELDVKVVLWCGKNLSEGNGQKPQSAVNFKPSPRIRRSGNMGTVALIFEAGSLIAMDVSVTKEKSKQLLC